ncbi:zinc finger protein 506 [Drosophila innubila]|uniref:zinc finger protein 506 n=1 Tax=Drosophila innubila TaxID=198719 RepID=UPI00148C8158|nr:zinc finger protein 506 [Drosophila innubila]
MFKSERNISACRALADTTTTESAASSSAKMSLCRACLVLLDSQDAAYDLCREENLAAKFFGCMATRTAPLDQDSSSEIVLQCICECCYQMVQKFHDFQCMCEESLRNFEKIMLEVNAKAEYCKDKEEKRIEVEQKIFETQLEEDFDLKQEEVNIQVQSESIEEIEEVYIIEDEAAKELLEKEKITISGKQGLLRRVGNKMDCHICGRGFYKMSLYEAHMQRHRGEQPYKCTVDQCEKTYARANLLTEHLKEAHHNFVTTYQCVEPNCNKVYTAIRSLNYHIRRQHTKDAKESHISAHICEKCGKSYGRRAHLTRHQWVHKSKGELKFACDYCVQRFYTNQNLQDHILRSHSYKQPFRCRRCGRIFESRGALSIHMKKSHSKSSV